MAAADSPSERAIPQCAAWFRGPCQRAIEVWWQHAAELRVLAYSSQPDERAWTRLMARSVVRRSSPRRSPLFPCSGHQGAPARRRAARAWCPSRASGCQSSGWCEWMGSEKDRVGGAGAAWCSTSAGLGGQRRTHGIRRRRGPRRSSATTQGWPALAPHVGHGESMAPR